MSEETQREFVPIENERGQTRQYETVASRIHRFRAAHPDWTIRCHVLVCDDEVVRMYAQIGYFTEAGHFVSLATGHAEEYRASEGINATSALENCETSAIGRALSFIGFGSPDSIASAEEVMGAQRKERVIQEARPGALIVLQKAADKGTIELERTWTKVLSYEDRQACRGSLAKLKRRAAAVDDETRNYQRESGG